MKMLQKILALLLSSWLLFVPVISSATQTDSSAGQSAPPVAKQTPEHVQQLVAPIALYPDALVSQILAAATYPTEIVEADRWVQDHPNLKGKDLANAVDQQPWDPSIKALTQFPSVLANLDKNLSWTSALGEAYVNQAQAVMDAVQVMRARAQAAGNLKSNEQVKVETQEKTIVIEPVQPEVVYVPAYNPWIVYGTPVVVWPGWYPYPGLYVAGPGVSFGVGFTLGFVAGFAWGWHGWGCDWGHGNVTYNHNTFISNSQTFSGGGQGGFRDYGAARGYQGHNSGAGRGYEGSRGAEARGEGFQGGAAERGPSESRTQPGESHAESGAHLALLEGTTTVVRRAPTRIGVPLACTAAVFMAEVSTVDSVLRITRWLSIGRNNHERSNCCSFTKAPLSSLTSRVFDPRGVDTFEPANAWAGTKSEGVSLS